MGTSDQASAIAAAAIASGIVATPARALRSGDNGRTETISQNEEYKACMFHALLLEFHLLSSSITACWPRSESIFFRWPLAIAIPN